MPVTGLDHFAILASDPERTKWFYSEIAGLTVGFRPPDLSFAGIWLYAGETPIIHVIFEKDIPSKMTGAVDHLSFKANGSADELVERLKANNIEFTKRTLYRTGITQVFCHDPDNVGVEFNYPAE
jgi:catechol 2,3-dioxygenase-like lactoylglutathione lyase family enzyme